MPRTLHPDLRDCLERANPYTEYRIEISEPDVGQVLRRQDQFTTAPSLVSLSPASSLAASARGGLILTPSSAALATYAGVAGSFDLNIGDTPDVRYKGLSWTIDAAFSRATLKSIVAKVQAVAFAGFFFDQSFELQIYQITRTPGVKVTNVGLANYQAIAFTGYSFAQLFSSAPSLKVTAAQWGVSATQTLTFDLSNFALVLENIPTRAVTPDQTGILPKYLIVIRLSGKSVMSGTGHFRWLTDTVASHTVASVGTFERSFWSRANENAQWSEQTFSDVPNITVNIEAYPASGQGVYLLDVGAVPRAVSTGRIEFQRALPPGTNANVELSTAGSGGPWFPVKHGDSLSVTKNLYVFPSQFDNAAWTKTIIGGGTVPVVTPNTGVDPDGRTTAAKVVFLAPTGADASILSQNGPGVITPGGIYTGSFYIKAFAAGDVGKVLLFRGVGVSTYTQITLTAAWQRLSPPETAVGALAYGEFALRPGVAGSSGTVSVLLWDAQLEAGPVATDYAVNFGAPQRQYHLRTTLTPDSSNHATPEVVAQGIEFRIPEDVSIEAVPTLPSREISVPWMKASIPEGKLRVVRTGIRDYFDVGSRIGSTSATSRLEADIFLASRHPNITRSKWFRLERMMVSNRQPSATSEEFTLLSYASRLKRKIPQKAETINSVHVVVSSTTSQVVINGATPLPGTTIGGNQYDGKNYYMRVRSTTATQVPIGFLAVIQGNTDTTKLDFVPALPQALVAGDIIEVHSGIFQTAAVTWTDYDPADAWLEVLTNLLAIPLERIGIGALPRGGKPPKVTDIAPGDATTQAKLKITGRLSEEVEGDKVIDILSTILGGVTLEIDGQIVFVQILPLTDALGQVTVPLPAPAAVFDIRDFSAPPQTPPGIEARATIVSAKYGVPATAASPDAFPSKSTSAVDGDALLWLQQQDLTEYGTADVPDEIAAWLYNTADEGLYLASIIPARLVRGASTGLRVWPLSMAEKHPTLVPGDVVVITTDQYTDYDPSSLTPIKGPIAVRGVLVRVGNEGRQLAMFVPGLRDNVTLIAGGAPGALLGLGPTPAAPVLSASFDSTGQLIINSTGDFATASQKIAWATGAAPSAATVRAATPIAQQNVSGLATGSFYPAGTTVFIAAFAYSGTALESTPLAVISASREGAGVSAPPKAKIVARNTEITETVWDLQFLAAAGSGGGGANLTYVVKYKLGVATESILASGNATTLPLDLSVSRNIRKDAVVDFTITDTATGLTDSVKITIPWQNILITDLGFIQRNYQYDDLGYATKASNTAGTAISSGVSESGGKLVNRLFGKALAADPDIFDSVPDGVTYKRILSVTGGQATGPSIAPLAITDAKINDMAAGKNTAGTLVSGVLESGGKAINRVLAKALAGDPDTLDSAPDGTVYKKVAGVVSNLITPQSSTGRFRCKASVTISLANNTPTFAAPTTEVYDTGNLHDNASNPSWVTVPVGGNIGVWRITGVALFANNATGYRGVAIYKNGVLTDSEVVVQAVSSGVLTAIQVSFDDDAPSVGDHYEVLVTQTSGGFLSTTITITAIHQW